MNRDQSTQLEALRAFQNIGEAVVRGEEIGDLAQLLLDEAHRAIGARAGIVCRRATPGAIDILAQYPRKKDRARADASAFMLELVAPLLSGERTTRIEDLPGAELDGPESRLRSYMEVPLVNASGKVTGAICVADTRAGVFSDEDRQFLKSLAPWIAHAMEGAGTTRSDERALVSGSEWIGSVAHDLRNPLQRICMVSELLTESLDASQQSLMSKLNRATASMETLITQLEDVLAVQKGTVHLERFETDLAPLVHRAVEAARELASSKGVELRGPPQQDLPPIMLDSARMEQSLGVLLDRLIEAGPGTKIELNCRDTEHAVHLELKVQTPAALPAALSSFLAQSNDLELMIAFGIVRLHRGQMSATLSAKDMLTLCLEWRHP